MKYLKKLPPLTYVLIVALLSSMLLFVLVLNHKLGSDANTRQLFIIIITVINLLVAIVSFVATYKSRSRYYLSFCSSDGVVVDEMIKNFSKMERVISSNDISIGLPIQDVVKKNISLSSICFVLIGSKVSEEQKIEIKEMKQQGKRIIPILLNEDSVLPASLKHYRAIKIDEFHNLMKQE